MATTQIGGSVTLQNLQENPDSPELIRNESGTTVTRKYNLLKSRVEAVTGALVYGTADSTYTASFLTSIRSRPVSATKVEISIMFEPEQLQTERLPAVGTITQEIDANPIDIPIKENAVATSQEVAQRVADGREAYLSPQPIYRRTEVLNAFTFNETNAINNVGKIDLTPEGLVAPTPEAWLKVGNVVRTVGDKFEKTEVWQYAENGWGTDLYQVVS